MKTASLQILGLLLAVLVPVASGACGDSGAEPADPTRGGEDGGPGGDGGTSADGSATDGAGGDGAEGVDAAAGEGGVGASCAGLPATCGGSKDCCASNPVTGGTFKRSNDAAFPATVSDFKLDVYEVTVGRFRSFVNAGRGTQASPPAAGDGAHPKIASSGWDPAWNVNLAATTAALRTALACRPDYPAWSDGPGANDVKPINCVTWFDAFAFCAWDGGRLPTETEWNYAAAGGSEQRDYPWGATIDTTKASYDCTGDGSGVGACAFSDILRVGSKSPQGDGRWGQADLAGNVWEWTLDWAATPYRLATCVDCADLQTSATKTFRGGGFPNESFYQLTSGRIDDVATDRDYDVGFRCAR